eukprot:1451309-Amphidinium_carterae.1
MCIRDRGSAVQLQALREHYLQTQVPFKSLLLNVVCLVCSPFYAVNCEASKQMTVNQNTRNTKQKAARDYQEQ